MKICLIIINYNNCQATINCLTSIVLNSKRPEYICIVDNGSTDNSLDQLFKFKNKGSIHFEILRLNDNLGYAGGCNRGIKHCKSIGFDYYVVANNDLIFHEKAFKNLSRDLNGRHDIIFGGNVKSTDGSYGKCVGVFHNNVVLPNFLNDSDRLIEREVSFISGCFLGICEKAIERNCLFDEKFFLYYEDVDLCIRLKKWKFKLVYFPNIELYHKESETMIKENVDTNYYALRNYIILSKQQLPRYKYILSIFSIAKVHIFKIDTINYYLDCFIAIFHGVIGRIGKK